MMPKYRQIYLDLKNKIESGEYKQESFLPSENTMTGVYDCSRNTLRNALSQLMNEGYIQSIHGKGARVIYQPITNQSKFTLGGIESFQESLKRNHKKFRTYVKIFAEMIVDKNLEKLTGFSLETEIYYIQRIRYIDEKPLIIDNNYFRKDVVEGLTKQIAEKSIYEYMENELHQNITMTKRTISVEKAKEADIEILDLGELNCIAVVTNYTFNDKGILFEFTQSRHHPEYFVFFDQAYRNKNS